MRISELRVHRATMPRVDPQWRTASYAASFLEELIIEVAADGVVGIGGAVARPKGVGADVLEAQLTGAVRDVLVGEDPFARTELLQRLRSTQTYRSVVSAVDQALHDLAGKVAKLPCYALWGGAVRASVPVIRFVGIKPPGEVVAAVAELMEHGFSYFKVKVGTGLEEDVARIRALRSAFGDAIWISVDGNGAYSVDEAIELSRALDPCGVTLLEQPIDYTDMDGLVRLTAASPIPVMADQAVTGIAAALEICQRKAAHVVTLKIGQAGTIDECRHVAQMCLAFGVRVHIGGGAHPAVVDAAAAQLAISIPGLEEACEIGESLAVTGDLTTGIRIQNGRYQPTAAPGLGAALVHLAEAGV